MNNYVGSCVRYIHGGREYFNLLEEMIRNAEESIHLQTYIFSDDTTGVKIADALIAAAQKGVKVLVLADGYASQQLGKEIIDRMRNAGVQFRFFEPLFASRKFYFGRRLHHKVVVTDSLRSLVGGLNIADRYNDMPEAPAWFDVALYVEGEISSRLNDICYTLWKNESRIRRTKPPPAQNRLHTGCKQHLVRIRRNDWVNRKQEIRRTYSELFNKAEKSITIVCSYFFPDKIFRTQLKRALRRGVRITVVLTGLSDVPFTKYAERFLYRWMLRNRIALYEYQPTVLHAKMTIVDDERLTIGSYNINNISRFASIELNLDVNSPALVSEVKNEVARIIEKDCKLIETATYKTGWTEQFLQWAAFHLIRFILSLSTFYFRQKE